MLLLLSGSIIGIITGLYIDLYLFIALYFFLFVLLFTGKNFSYKYLIFLISILIFNFYAVCQTNKYDLKYNNGIIKDTFKIISYADESDYYNKYICKNSVDDKFLVYIPNNKEYKKGSIILIEGEFVLPDLVRNTGRI